VPDCAACGQFVTTDYVRVFGKDGSVSACPECSTIRERAQGDGATRDDGNGGTA